MSLFSGVLTISHSITEHVEFKTHTFEEPQEASVPLQLRPGESLLASAVHEIESFTQSPLNLSWEMVDTLYSSFENLQTLQINSSPSPGGLCDSDPSAKEKDAVEFVVRHLPLLRARRNFALTFTVDGEPIPWRTLGR